MKHMIHEMKMIFNGIEIEHITYMEDVNRMQAEIYSNFERCIFSGYSLEAPEYYMKEKNRLQDIAERYGAEIIILK